MHFQNPALYTQRVVLVCITCLSISNFSPVPQFCYYSGVFKLLFTIHLDIKLLFSVLYLKDEGHPGGRPL